MSLGMSPEGFEPSTWRITAIFLLGTSCLFNNEQQCQINQWLKRPLLFYHSIERNGFQREKRGEIVYILYIVSFLYAPELHQETMFY
jgi:hypothetical protein